MDARLSYSARGPSMNTGLCVPAATTLNNLTCCWAQGKGPAVLLGYCWT